MSDRSRRQYSATADESLRAFLAWLASDYLAPVLAQIAADEDLARGHCGSYG